MAWESPSRRAHVETLPGLAALDVSVSLGHHMGLSKSLLVVCSLQLRKKHHQTRPQVENLE